MIRLPNRYQIDVTFEWLAQQLGILGKDGSHIVAVDVEHKSNRLTLLIENNEVSKVSEGSEAERLIIKRTFSDD